jgi:hypothetical protein
MWRYSSMHSSKWKPMPQHYNPTDWEVMRHSSLSLTARSPVTGSPELLLGVHIGSEFLTSEMGNYQRVGEVPLVPSSILRLATPITNFISTKVNTVTGVSLPSNSPEQCHLRGCRSVWLLLESTFRGTVSLPTLWSHHRRRHSP